jgi:hypothetical protein
MSALIKALQDRDANGLESALAPAVVFNSPVRTYTERADVVHLLRTLADLFENVTVVREWPGSSGVATFIEVEAEVGRKLDGVIEELHDSQGLVVAVTLMLRPLGALLAAVERMGQALEAAPLPSLSPSPAGRASPR